MQKLEGEYPQDLYIENEYMLLRMTERRSLKMYANMFGGEAATFLEELNFCTEQKTRQRWHSLKRTWNMTFGSLCLTTRIKIKLRAKYVLVLGLVRKITNSVVYKSSF